MAKIHKYVGLDGAKKIWEKTGEKFVDDTELNYVINNMKFSLNNGVLTLSIPLHNGNGYKNLQVDLGNTTGGFSKQVLTADQYNDNGVPIIDNPDPTIIYLVPTGDTQDIDNEYSEWTYDETIGWEMIGGPAISDKDILKIVED